MSKLSEKIKAADDTSAEPYDIPEWGVILSIRSMTARSRATFVADMATEDGDMGGINSSEKIEALWWNVISQTCFDPETGDPAFEAGDELWLFNKNARIVNDLANRCMEASGLTEEASTNAGKDFSALQIAEEEEALNEDSTSD
mgnify:CR=1 FL=1